ncbi:MAG: hypothetical protein JXA21_20355 [Anaerolineae bacterium]|nr:hypothetical protein [Anaerolineae bacterium]
MQTLQATLTDTQCQRLTETAETHNPDASPATGVLEVFLGPEAADDGYARLAQKQALWRTSPQPLDALRLDLIYHSEALEGSPLTRSQVASAILEPLPQ